MLYLFLITSGLALKLSDPVSLRDISEENVSLRAWCVGVGCVMPFTPASCLSWCDWNVDKQADAEARGAFGGTHWGEKKQHKATEYFIILAHHSQARGAAANTCVDADKKKYYFQATGTGKDSGVADGTNGADSAVFPGGDADTQFRETFLTCSTTSAPKCYKIASGDPKDLTLETHYYIDFTKSGTSVKMRFFLNNACSGATVYDPLIPDTSADTFTSNIRDANGAKKADSTVTFVTNSVVGVSAQGRLCITFAGTIYKNVHPPRSCA